MIRGEDGAASDGDETDALSAWDPRRRALPPDVFVEGVKTGINDLFSLCLSSVVCAGTGGSTLGLGKLVHKLAFVMGVGSPWCEL